MSRFTLPTGRYFTAPIDLPLDSGGQTRALLMRNRMFVTEAGIAPTVLTFTAYDDFAGRREALLERGLLIPEIATANIYEHYRTHGWGPTGNQDPVPLRDLSNYEVAEQLMADGSPMRVTYRLPAEQQSIIDYLRPDGSPYLRIPKFVFGRPDTWPSSIQRIDEQGRVIGEFGSVSQWFRRWVNELSGGERSFVFVDSRYNAQQVIPMRAPNIHLIYVMHNIHLNAPREWSSPLPEMYRRVLNKVDGMDAMVSLTHRQSDDIALRRGRTTNLFVVSNPVEMPPDVEHPPRDPHLVVVVARLEDQKRIDHAISAFALVREQVPQARLDIYGDGTRRGALQAEVDRRGLGDAVTLKGHDPRARDAMSTASAFLVTSAFEGWNLALQESMSHGCPVVSYDVKYGPREQITDGVDSFLVQDGDQQAMAERVVRLLTSTELVETMSRAAIERTRTSRTRFMESWQQVLESVVEIKPRRTRVTGVDAHVTRVRLASRGARRRLARPWGAVVPTVAGPRDKLVVAATVRVDGHSPESDLGSATFTLASVDQASGSWVELPLSVRRKGNLFTLRSSFVLADAVAGAPAGAGLRLRLRLVWENSTWETFVERAPGITRGVEVSYLEGGVVSLRAPTADRA